MNINTLIEMIVNFNQLVIESGFLRDIQEYIKTIAQPQNSQNIVLLKEITTKTNQSLITILNTDLPIQLTFLIPKDQNNIFTNNDYLVKIDELLNDPQIDTVQYHAKLNQLLNALLAQIVNNQTTINQLNTFITPYYEAQAGKDKLAENAVMSIIFKNESTITNLKQFSNSLLKWNRAIHMYHQLVSPNSPKDVELVNIQNGSLDVIINMDVNVAINFTEIVKIGLKTFIGYLIYKNSVKDIVKSYFGNPKLVESENEREIEMLKNIGQVIEMKITEQYKQLSNENKSIKPTGPEKMIDEVTKTIAEHIVSGNDIKLLVKSEEPEIQNIIKETNQDSLYVRNQLKNLSNDDKTMLLEHYTNFKEVEEDHKHEGAKKEEIKNKKNT